MIHDAANPEDPGTQLCTPKLHTRAAPLPSIHVKAAPLSLSNPNMFCRSNDQNEFVRNFKSDSFRSLFMSGLWLRQDQPISNPNKEEEEEENE